MGRPRGSRNRNTLARELMAAVNDKDSDFDPAIELCSQTSSQASALLVWTQKPKRQLLHQHSHYQRHHVRRRQ